MDIATIVGLVLAWALIIGSLLMGGAGIGAYIDGPSMMIVIGGSIGAVMIAFPFSRIRTFHKVCIKTLLCKSTPIPEIIDSFVTFAEVARRDGILSLESMVENIDDPFIVRGIQMAVDGTDPELIETIMEADLENQVLRHQQGKSLLDNLGRYCPAFGMIGTLIGLVAMLANMSDPSGIGSGMAVALITTLYGALLANVVFIPMADKLAARSAEEVLRKTVIIRGIMSIQAGDNPRIVEQKLLTYVPMAERKTEDKAAAKAA